MPTIIDRLSFFSSARLRSVTVLGLVALFASACAVHVRPVAPAPKVVRVKADHVHTRSCGHAVHHGRTVLIAGHVHKRGCGHVHRRGVWVLRR